MAYQNIHCFQEKMNEKTGMCLSQQDLRTSAPHSLGTFLGVRMRDDSKVIRIFSPSESIFCFSFQGCGLGVLFLLHFILSGCLKKGKRKPEDSFVLFQFIGSEHNRRRIRSKWLRQHAKATNGNGITSYVWEKQSSSPIESLITETF